MNSIGARRSLSIIAISLLIFIYAKNTSGIAYPAKARIVEFTYEVRITGVPGGARGLKIWIPAASENPYQDVTLETKHPIVRPKVVRDKIFHNKILYYSFKPQEGEIGLDLDYKVRRYERSGRSSGRDRADSPSLKFVHRRTLAKADSEKAQDLAKYLTSNRLMVVSEEIEELASRIVKGRPTTIEKARAIYDYVITNLAYDKSIPGWGMGDTMRACSVKAGNCTDFHSLFVSLARASGIPAKFVMGFSIPRQREGRIDSYHCWAEFYDERLGWLPVDISEAWKNREKEDYYFGNVDEDRIEFTEGRDIILEPPSNAGALNYFIYPYVELDGRYFENVKVHLRFEEAPRWQGGA